MPDISHELQEQVLTACSEQQRLSISGGGSKAFMGRLVSDARPLPVSGHSGIISYQPVELVLRARAGTPLAEINAALDEHNQMLSFEPPLFDGKATIGGTLATNQSGPGRPWGGSVRDNVLGTGLINGKGEMLNFGGQVMKNVAGFDASRLQAGAMGSLGVITDVSLKVLPRPACSVTLVQEIVADEVVEYMNRRAAEPQPLNAACWLDGHLYLRLAGAESAVSATVKKWQNRGGYLLEDDAVFWQQIRDQRHTFFAGERPLWRFSVGSASEHCSLPGDWLLDWGGAQRWYRGEAEAAELQQLAENMGGQVSLYRGGDRRGEVMHPQNAVLQTLQQRLRHAFDPHGVFAGDRLYSWL